MKKLSQDAKLLLGAFTGTFALVLALGLRAPAGDDAAGHPSGQVDVPATPATAANGPVALAGTQPRDGARQAQPSAQASPNAPPAPPVVPTPPEVIEADRWAVGEPPNNNY